MLVVKPGFKFNLNKPLNFLSVGEINTKNKCLYGVTLKDGSGSTLKNNTSEGFVNTVMKNKLDLKANETALFFSPGDGYSFIRYNLVNGIMTGSTGSLLSMRANSRYSEYFNAIYQLYIIDCDFELIFEHHKLPMKCLNDKFVLCDEYLIDGKPLGFDDKYMEEANKTVNQYMSNNPIYPHPMSTFPRNGFDHNFQNPQQSNGFGSNLHNNIAKNPSFHDPSTIALCEKTIKELNQIKFDIENKLKNTVNSIYEANDEYLKTITQKSLEIENNVERINSIRVANKEVTDKLINSYKEYKTCNKQRDKYLFVCIFIMLALTVFNIFI